MRAESLKSQTAYFNYVAGYFSQDEAATYATGKDRADVPEPRAAPQPISPTGSKVTDPGIVQSEPGGNRTHGGWRHVRTFDDGSYLEVATAEDGDGGNGRH